MAEGRRPRQLPSHGVTGLVSLLLVVGVLVVTIFYSLPSNVLSARDGGRVRTLSVHLAQQSWVFFTRPPTETEFQPFALRNDGSVVSTLKFPQGRAENWFGLKRTQRAQGPEIADLVSGVPGDSWVECNVMSNFSDCLNAAESAAPVTVGNTSTVPSICGLTLLLESEPVRWSFRDVYDSERLPVRSIKLDVTCPEGGGAP